MERQTARGRNVLMGLFGLPLPSPKCRTCQDSGLFPSCRVEPWVSALGYILLHIDSRTTYLPIEPHQNIVTSDRGFWNVFSFFLDAIEEIYKILLLLSIQNK